MLITREGGSCWDSSAHSRQRRENRTCETEHNGRKGTKVRSVGRRGSTVFVLALGFVWIMDGSGRLPSSQCSYRTFPGKVVETINYRGAKGLNLQQRSTE